uniref:Uncharacterized protein n=1 Tax=Cucumis sativus TaxID=3659 RepID=A0A0A0KM44_CUCSA
MQGTDAVKVIKLDLSNDLSPTSIDAQAFKNMKNLKLLILRNITFSSHMFEYGLNKFKWVLSSFGIRFSSLPASFLVKEGLVGLDMQHCCIKYLGNRFENCERLKHVDLSYCELLEEIPDLSVAVNLEYLYLRGCISLKTIHESVSSLNKLITLDLEGCVNLEKLPSYLMLKSLDSFCLSDCRKLQRVPEFDENMKSLTRMILDYTAIEELPSSIEHLAKLEFLSLKGCANLVALPSEIYLLRSLVELRLPGCSKLHMFPCPTTEQIFLLSKLTILDLKNCNLSNIDFLEPLSTELQLKNCNFLLQIPNLPHSIQTMDARGCESLVTGPDNLDDIIYANQDRLNDSGSREFILMNGMIPEWFNHQTTTTSSISVSLQHCPQKTQVLAACVIFKVDGDSCEAKASIKYDIFIDGESLKYFEITVRPSSKSEYMWLITTPLTFSSVSMSCQVSCTINKTYDNARATIRSLGVHIDVRGQQRQTWNSSITQVPEASEESGGQIQCDPETSSQVSLERTVYNNLFQHLKPQQHKWRRKAL